MRENRSADPWSAFLAPSGRSGGVRPPGAALAGEPGRAAGYADPAAEDACRRVLAQLRAANGPLSLEQIHHSTRLGLLEVADAVDRLRDRGLVAVEREIDEVVRLTGE
ncbi:hypothetical protein BKA00_000515 [Actinomadura coerulea]|uniref:Uncharacterized protein n=1 Tax=Actinomadura coerulea TaxID=46159 RepID=A0A7X0KWS9_9ACTN|nr:hypothetical protein [Actinomadura coerulea]MBB6393601.1 hypothetical protein [Actinomadura coerulea]GGP91692.1 hypothetical protein GCM10010187_03850 [Actinomadura coerulea]